MHYVLLYFYVGTCQLNVTLRRMYGEYTFKWTKWIFCTIIAPSEIEIATKKYLADWIQYVWKKYSRVDVFCSRDGPAPAQVFDTS